MTSQLRAATISSLALGTAIALAVAFSVSPAHAQLYWDTNGATAGSGDAGGTWDFAAPNWSSNPGGTVATGLWADGQQARFSAGIDGVGPLSIGVTGTVAPSSVVVEEGTIDWTSGTVNSGNITIQGGSTLDISGATATASNVTISNNTTGTLSVSGTGSLTASLFNVGNPFGVSGTVNQSGGTISLTGGGSNAGMRLAHYSGETSIYNLSGGTLNATNGINVGWDGNGDMNVTGVGNASINGGTGTLIQRDSFLTISDDATYSTSIFRIGQIRGTGTLEIQGNATVTTPTVSVGDTTGVGGTIDQTGGTFTVSGELRLAHWSGANSTYDMTGGTLNANGGLYVGWDGIGDMNVGGTAVVSAPAGTTIWRGSDLTIGDSASFTTNLFRVGDGPRGDGTLNIEGSANVMATNVSVGDDTGDAGTINQSGGTFTVTSHFRLGHWPSETSTYNMSGGALNLTGTPAGGTEQAGILYVGVDGTGIFNQTDGDVTAAGLRLDNRGDTGGTDIYAMTGGTLTLGSAGITANASTQVDLGGGTVGASASWSTSVPLNLTGTGGDVTFDTTGGTITLDGQLTGAGGLMKAGPGTLNINRAAGPSNSYAGPLTVNGGTVAAQGFGGDATISGDVVINSGGTFRLDNDNIVRNTSDFTINGSGTFDVNGRSDAIGSLAGDGSVINNTNGSGLVLDDLSGNTTFTGTISGTGPLALRGNATDGNQTLAGSGTSSYGNIRVEGEQTLTLAGSSTHNVSGGVGLGFTGSNASLAIEETATLNTTNLFLGEQATRGGTVTQTGGTVNVSGQLRIGHWPSETSTYNMSGGALNLTGTPAGGTEQAGILYVGIDGTGIFNQTDGDVTAAGLRLDNRGDTPGTDIYAMTGGTLTLGNAGITANASTQVDLGGGTVAASANWSSSVPMNLTGTGGDVTFDTAGNTIDLSGQLSGSGGLIKDGAGTLTLSNGGNTYGGTTTVNDGTLNVPGSLASADIVVNGGSLLGPGTVHFNITGPASDLIDLNGGALDISNMTLDFDLVSPIGGMYYVLVDYSDGGALTTAGSPDFFGSVLDLPPTRFIIDTGTQLLLVPEASTLCLAGWGLLALGLRRRRRRRGA